MHALEVAEQMEKPPLCQLFSDVFPFQNVALHFQDFSPEFHISIDMSYHLVVDYYAHCLALGSMSWAMLIFFLYAFSISMCT